MYNCHLRQYSFWRILTETLIYRDKTTQSLPRYQFPEGFPLRVNEKCLSNSKEPVKFLNKIIMSYVKKMRKSKDLGTQQIALVITDVFTGKMALKVRENLQKNNILANNDPANMARFYQPLDLSVNESAKRFIAKKLNGWYSDQISEGL